MEAHKLKPKRSLGIEAKPEKIPLNQNKTPKNPS